VQDSAIAVTVTDSAETVYQIGQPHHSPGIVSPDSSETQESLEFQEHTWFPGAYLDKVHKGYRVPVKAGILYSQDFVAGWDSLVQEGDSSEPIAGQSSNPHPSLGTGQEVYPVTAGLSLHSAFEVLKKYYLPIVKKQIADSLNQPSPFLKELGLKQAQSDHSPLQDFQKLPAHYQNIDLKSEKSESVKADSGWKLEQVSTVPPSTDHK
jgi:hypothetical protein